MAARATHLDKSSVWIILSDCAFVLLYLFVFFFPTDIEELQLRVQIEPLKINLPESSPPFAVLQDERILPLIEQVVEKPKGVLWIGTEELNTGAYVYALHQAREFKELERQIIVSQELKALRPQTRQLNGMTLFKTDQAASKNQPAVMLHEPKKITAKVSSLTRTPVNSSFIERWVQYQTQNKMEVASTDRDARELFLGDKSTDHGAMLTGTREKPKQKWVGNIWVGLPSEVQNKRPKASVPVQAKNERTKRKPSDMSYERLRTAENTSKGRGSGDSDAVLGFTDSWPSSARIHGYVNLTDGLAHLGGAENLRIFRYIAGAPTEEATIDHQNGTYEMDVESPERGLLVAELRDHSGKLIGLHETLFFDLKESILKDPDNALYSIYVSPVEDRYSREIALYDEGVTGAGSAELDASIEIDEFNIGATINEKGRYSIENLLRGSNFLAKIKSRSFWKGLFYSSSEERTKVQIPSARYIEKIEAASGSQLDHDTGIIWGEITSEGKSLEGAEIEIATRGVSRPYYIDDEGNIKRSSSGTFSNGRFVFVNVPQGTHLIRARINGRHLQAKVIQTRRGFVSHIEIERAKKKKAEVYVFDAMTGQPLEADIRFMGGDQVVSSESGYLGIKYFRGNDPLSIEARSHQVGYYPARVIATRNTKSISIPFVSVSWVSALRGKEKINNRATASFVVGQIYNSNFRVHLPENAMTEESRIVYFDESGRVMRSASWGVSGGGFVAFNINPGVHNVIIETEFGHKFATRVLVVESDSPTVFTHHF